MSLTQTTKTVLDGASGNVTTRLYSDGTALGPISAIILADGTLLTPGQALAAASLPVVLPAAQITSLIAPVLAAGTAIVGKVGVDQTTPGTTNAVAPTARYNATPPTFTDGQRGELQFDAAGNLFVNPCQLAVTKDAVLAGQVVGVVYSAAGVAYTVKRKRVTISNTTATSVVPAVTSKQIFPLAYTVQNQNGTPCSFNFQDDAGTPIILSRTWVLDQSGAAGTNGFSSGPPSPWGCGVDPTTAGQALMGKLSAAGSVVVEVTYIEI